MEKVKWKRKPEEEEQVKGKGQISMQATPKICCPQALTKITKLVFSFPLGRENQLRAIFVSAWGQQKREKSQNPHFLRPSLREDNLENCHSKSLAKSQFRFSKSLLRVDFGNPL